MSNLEQLHHKLKKAWCAATSSDPAQWNARKPAYGQCAVTACLVQDHFGGEIVWSQVTEKDGSKISHYFNKINGNEIDLTRDQFSREAVFSPTQPKTGNFNTTRDYVLSFPATQQRYALLKKRMDDDR